MLFRKASEPELDEIRSILQERIDWMDRVGIRQWNKTHYFERYPRAYFRKNLKDLYVLVGEGGAILAAGMLYSHDPRWDDDGAKAFYVHHLASRLRYQDAGRAFLLEAEALAKKEGKRFLRLDSALGNQKLAQYYASLGYQAVGTCEDGPYQGVLRQKEIR